MVKKSHKRHKHKKHYYTKKRKSYNKNKKGGNGSNIINPANLQSTPNQIYSFPAGSTSAANAAQNYLNTMSQKQTELNHHLHNGGGGGKKKQSKKQRGGVADIIASAATASGAPPGDYYSCTAQNPNFTTVAQFSSSGPDVSPLNANNSSITTNATSITGKNNALNDCYASGTCQEVDCPASEAGTSASEAGEGTSANEVGAAEAPTPTQSGGSRKKRRIKKKGKKSKKSYKSKGTKRI